MQGYLEEVIQISMAQGRSSKVILMMQWIRISGLSIKNSPSVRQAKMARLKRSAGGWLRAKIARLQRCASGLETATRTR